MMTRSNQFLFDHLELSIAHKVSYSYFCAAHQPPKLQWLTWDQREWESGTHGPRTATLLENPNFARKAYGYWDRFNPID
jgi:hypothetical protein